MTVRVKKIVDVACEWSLPDDGVDLLDGGGHVGQHGVVRLGVAQPRQRPPHVAQGRAVQDGEGVSVPGGR